MRQETVKNSPDNTILVFEKRGLCYLFTSLSAGKLTQFSVSSKSVI